MLSNKIFDLLLGLLAITFAGCDKDDTDPNIPLLRLTPDNVTGKSGRDIEATLSITAPSGAKDITIYKTINLEKDAEYGTVTVAPVDLGNNQYEYKFNYQLAPEEVDSLVGFNFRFTDAKELRRKRILL